MVNAVLEEAIVIIASPAKAGGGGLVVVGVQGLHRPVNTDESRAVGSVFFSRLSQHQVMVSVCCFYTRLFLVKNVPHFAQIYPFFLVLTLQ